VVNESRNEAQEMAKKKKKKKKIGEELRAWKSSTRR